MTRQTDDVRAYLQGLQQRITTTCAGIDGQTFRADANGIPVTSHQRARQLQHTHRCLERRQPWQVLGAIRPELDLLLAEEVIADQAVGDAALLGEHDVQLVGLAVIVGRVLYSQIIRSPQA